MQQIQRVFLLGLVLIIAAQASLFDGEEPDPTSASHKRGRRAHREIAKGALEEEYKKRMQTR